MPFTEADAAEYRAAGFEPRCEYGAVDATSDSVTSGPAAGTIARIAHYSNPEATWLVYYDGQKWMGTFYSTAATTTSRDERTGAHHRPGHGLTLSARAEGPAPPLRGEAAALMGPARTRPGGRARGFRRDTPHRRGSQIRGDERYMFGSIACAIFKIAFSCPALGRPG